VKTVIDRIIELFSTCYSHIAQEQ